MIPDFERPLAPRGERDAPRAGEHLKKRGRLPDQIFSSPAVRARDTALAVVRAMDMPQRAIHFDERLYAASRQTLLRVLAECPAGARCVLVVGHNPGLDDLLEFLADTPPLRTAESKLLTTAALACLETHSDWSGLKRHGARLVELWRPEEGTVYPSL
jgi:phosphohistidine phosphatase